MWHNPILLRGIAATLFFCSTVALIYAIAYRIVTQPDLLPLQKVELVYAPHRMPTDLVEKIVAREVTGNFFTVNIERLRLSLADVPWVRNVKVKRVFPDRLLVEIEEHQPMARWNQDAMVNVFGEVFQGKTDMDLPYFIGQEGKASKVTDHFTLFSQQIAPLGLSVRQIALSSRDAWQVYLENDMLLELGRSDMEQRLQRFIKMYPIVKGKVTELGEGLIVVDLRYRNGFAVRREEMQRRSG